MVRCQNDDSSKCEQDCFPTRLCFCKNDAGKICGSSWSAMHLHLPKGSRCPAGFRHCTRGCATLVDPEAVVQPVQAAAAAGVAQQAGNRRPHSCRRYDVLTFIDRVVPQPLGLLRHCAEALLLAKHPMFVAPFMVPFVIATPPP
jgi:hypothetical protein